MNKWIKSSWINTCVFENHLHAVQIEMFSFLITIVETDNQYSNVSKITKPSRKKADNQIKNNSKLVPPLSDTEEIDKTQETEDEDNVYMNETPTRYIPVEQLTAVIAEKRAKGDEGFRKEYAVSDWPLNKMNSRFVHPRLIFESLFYLKALPSGEINTCEVGKKPENIPKNRFKTTFPCKWLSFVFLCWNAQLRSVMVPTFTLQIHFEFTIENDIFYLPDSISQMTTPELS